MPPLSRTSRPPSHQETLQQRLQREAAEFKQLQQTARQQQGGAARPHSAQGRSPSRSSSLEDGEAAGAARRPARSRSSSSERGHRHSNSGSPRRAGGRWGGADGDDGAGAASGADAPKPPAQRSRWHAEDADGVGAARRRAAGDGGADLEEGEAPPEQQSAAAAVDEELEALNRRERAELEAGGDLDSSDAVMCACGGSPGGASASEDGGVDAALEGLPFIKSMLEESRRVEEYERLNRISGVFVCVRMCVCVLAC